MITGGQHAINKGSHLWPHLFFELLPLHAETMITWRDKPVKKTAHAPPVALTIFEKAGFMQAAITVHTGNFNITTLTIVVATTSPPKLQLLLSKRISL